MNPQYDLIPIRDKHGITIEVEVWQFCNFAYSWDPSDATLEIITSTPPASLPVANRRQMGNLIRAIWQAKEFIL